MNLCLIGHNFRYELEKLLRIFMPFEKIEFFETEVLGECYAVTEISGNTAKAKVSLFGETRESETELEDGSEKDKELKLALSLYNCLTSLSGYIPQWGILTGVRPAKLYSRLISSNGLEKAEDWF